jgi:serine/threonine protein kinase/formylglycine-generating enzyme required for sulfatase activity
MNDLDQLIQIVAKLPSATTPLQREQLLSQVFKAADIPLPLRNCISAERSLSYARCVVLYVVKERFENGEPILPRFLTCIRDEVVSSEDHQRLDTLQLNTQQPAAELASGAVIDGKYRLDEALGAGGNGAVWRIYHLDLQRDQAMKVLHPRYSHDAERVARFRREMRTVANLEHQHIIQVYDTGQLGDQLYVVMQYIDGNALSRLTKGQAHDLDTVIDWLAQVASALDFAHASGIVHRDVKPDNILRRTSDGRLFLADFGLVFSHGDNDDPRLTATNTSVGTTYYMAPEQVDVSHGDITPVTDIYALGIVAYELLTGHVPFTGSKQDIKEAHRYQDLPDDRHLPDEVLAVLRRACAKVPGNRYRSAGAFVEALRNWEADPENLELKLKTYAKMATSSSNMQDLREKFVDEEAEQTILAALPHTEPVSYNPFDDLFDYDAGLSDRDVQTEADVTPREQTETQHIGNVQDHLLTVERGVLLGEPGSGKTWTLLRLLLDLCGQLADGEPVRVPVLVKLNRFKGAVPRTDPPQPQTFAEFVRASTGPLAPYLNRLARDGRLLLLCDALNEMPRTGPDGRDLLADVVGYLDDQPYFIVSCRWHDYKNDLADLHPLEQVRLRDLELPAIREFINKYLPEPKASNLWQAMGGSDLLYEFWQAVNDPERNDEHIFWDPNANVPSYTSVESDNAWREMHSGARLIPLCRKPYMGSMLTQIYTDSGAIPANRSELFGGFVNKLLNREQANARKRGDTFPAFDEIREALTTVAHAMQRAKGTALADDAMPNGVARPLLDAAEAATILAYDGTNWTFTHQLLQEYFAARVLLAAMERGDDPGQHITGNWWEPGVWRETAVILGEVADPNEVAAWMAPFSPWLALLVLTENAEYQAGQVKLTRATKAALIDSANRHKDETNPVGRAAAYRVLGHPDIDADDREGVGLRPDGLPDIAWEPVEPGGYPVGGDDKAYNPLEAQTYTVSEGVKIARYPVTYAQFEAFVASDAFKDTTHSCWADMPEDQRGEQAISDQRYKYANHPRENVSWYGAAAFCRWLTAQYRQANIIGENEMITLPDERLWEAAARGKDGAFYPFGGNEHDPSKANVPETGIGQTSAVGIFPEGAADCDALDMSGNVWEWTASKFDDPEFTSIDATNNRRVLRGAAFDDLSADDLRAAARNFDPPHYRFLNFGFRVCVVPISSDI